MSDWGNSCPHWNVQLYPIFRSSFKKLLQEETGEVDLLFKTVPALPCQYLKRRLWYYRIPDFVWGWGPFAVPTVPVVLKPFLLRVYVAVIRVMNVFLRTGTAGIAGTDSSDFTGPSECQHLLNRYWQVLKKRLKSQLLPVNRAAFTLGSFNTLF